MIIKNPTKDSIEVSIKGVTYKIEAEGVLEGVPEEAARYWQENLHKFLILRKEKEVSEETEPEPVVTGGVTAERMQRAISSVDIEKSSSTGTTGSLPVATETKQEVMDAAVKQAKKSK